MPPKKSPVSMVHSFIDEGNLDGLFTYLQCLPSSDVVSICKEEVPRKGTSLHVAAKLGHLHIVKFLIETVGLDVNLKHVEGHVVSGQTPLHESCLAGQPDIVEYLITKGAKVNAREQDGQSPLHCATQGRSSQILKLLLENGAVIDAPDNRGQTPLQMSILRSPTDMITVLIEHGPDLQVLDADGQTPLHYAVDWENMSLVETLLERGVDVNLQDKDGQSPVHLCVATGNTDILDLLLDYGGDPRLRDKWGKPAIEKQLDMEKDEYKAINHALAQHLEKMEVTAPQHTAAAAEMQERFNKLTVAGDAQVKAAKTHVMAELMVTAKRKRDATDDELECKVPCKPSPLAAAGVLGELKAKTQPL